MRTVLFVCTGNTCRSPMAEAIARQFLSAGGLGGEQEVFVASAGLGATEGQPTSPETLESLAALGIEHEGRSKRLTAQMVRKADLIFCMTSSQQAAARALVAESPEHQEKIVLLDAEQDIEDPVGMGQEAYDALQRQLLTLVPRRLQDALPDIAQKSAS